MMIQLSGSVFGCVMAMRIVRFGIPAFGHLAMIAALSICVLSMIDGASSPLEAASLRQGNAAFAREDYVTASRIFIPLAQQGDPVAQTYLGFMFQYGRGVPQNYTEAAYWYRRAAEQGNGDAQYSLGLLYDKGFGVREDLVEANKWLNLAASSASRSSRDYRTRLRDAVGTKMTRGQIAESRLRALEWFPKPER